MSLDDIGIDYTTNVLTTSGPSTMAKAKESPTLLKFEPGSMVWKAWRSRYNNYVKILELTTEDDQKRLLLDSLGVEAHEMLFAMCLPQDPAELKLDEVIAHLEHAYVKKTLQSTEWANFFLLKQEVGETLLDFANKLRRKAVLCSFPADALEGNMRAAFLNGVQNEATQRHLRTKEIDVLAKALNIAEQYELAQLKRTATTTEVARIDGGQKGRSEPHPKGRNGGTRPGRGDGNSGKMAGSSGACYACGGKGHVKADCWAKEATCRKCGKKGHVAKACKPPPKGDRGGGGRRTWTVQEDFDVLAIGEEVGGSIRVPITLNHARVSMLLDTGSGVTIITASTWRQIGSPKLTPYATPLQSFTGHPIQVIGSATMPVVYGRARKSLPVVVVDRGGDVLGRDWIKALDLSHLSLKELQVSSVSKVTARATVQSILDRHSSVFREELGHCKEFKAHLYLKEGAKPVFCKPRTVPFAYRDAVEKDLDRLVEREILTPVEHADWAAPIVGTQKRAGDIRTCADLSTGLNDSLDVQTYPLPTPDELFAKLNGGDKFSSLDLAEAYAQIELDDKSKQLVVINTHKGLFRYNRLPFGVASGPSIFQHIIERILQGCEGVAVYIDDIIVTGKTDEEHQRNLEAVLERLEKYGLRVKLSKCRFMQESVEYLGFVVDRRGRHISHDRMKALVDMKMPTNVSELRAYLGMFQALKEEIVHATFLVHFNPAMPLVLAADASQYGVGAVLCHRFPDGTERPIAHASKSLSAAEKNYGPIEKEALALVYGCKKFHQYVAGREFTLLTDHKPLLSVFGKRKGVPVVMANRLQRWALLLMGYTFSIEYRRTEEFGQADGLSRLPLHSTQLEKYPNLGMDNVASALHVESAENIPVSVEDIARETAADAELQEVRQCISRGWPDSVSDRIRPYKKVQHELGVLNGCVCWGSRTVIPAKYRPRILKHLHAAHMGAGKMKGEARGYCWWPSMDRDIEQVAKDCRICTERAGETAKVPLAQWPVPDAPWKRDHMDFAGPYRGTMLLVVVDAMFKWPEVVQMKHATTEGVMEALLTMFSRYGVCNEVVSDNGTPFTSQQFVDFCSKYGIKHTRTPPGHPQSNGQAELYVQTVKDGVAKLMADCHALPDALRQFLWRYRSAPHATTGQSPAELFIGRKLRSTLDLLVPVMATATERNRERYQKNFDKRTKSKEFHSGQLVLVRDYRLNRTVDWISGKLVRRYGTKVWDVKVGDLMWRRHVNQMRPRSWLEMHEMVEAEIPPSANAEATPPAIANDLPEVTTEALPTSTANDAETVETEPDQPKAQPDAVKVSQPQKPVETKHATVNKPQATKPKKTKPEPWVPHLGKVSL
ncbi:uncharacterized protein K02A2.6-like [Paramacrobiotus metropolitanus]|uniref:uncharacterized protein K02A2.6-like n=1 Tax=Paramacrobiotus metropolitanus TaxID=2943436 RepID=UPI0024464551|nr:uncharacterized protein K02A2.6-like [Paramacrobiotus metropolitanus]